MPEAQQHWDEHYGERARVWSGRVNARLAEVAESLTPGRALDLGCGEGADAVWLAERGWQVVAVDISGVALQRAADDARARDLLGSIDFQQHDLSDSFPVGSIRPGVGAVPAFHRPVGPGPGAAIGRRRGRPRRAADDCGPRRRPAVGVEAGA